MAKTAAEFRQQLETQRSPEQPDKHHHLKADADDIILGVRMGTIFEMAKGSLEMPLGELEIMLDSPIHEMRVGALSIMDKQARHKKTASSQRQALFDLYIRRHERINNWDLVDLAAPFVVGGYLYDKPRDLLYELARSRNTWERRTAMVATLYFIRQREVDDAFKIAEILLHDEQDLIHKAMGWALREAGKVDRQRLITFLDQFTPVMPRTTLRYAIEHFDSDQRAHYLSIKRVK